MLVQQQLKVPKKEIAQSTSCRSFTCFFHTRVIFRSPCAFGALPSPALVVCAPPPLVVCAPPVPFIQHTLNTRGFLALFSLSCFSLNSTLDSFKPGENAYGLGLAALLPQHRRGSLDLAPLCQACQGRTFPQRHHDGWRKSNGPFPKVVAQHIWRQQLLLLLLLLPFNDDSVSQVCVALFASAAPRGDLRALRPSRR